MLAEKFNFTGIVSNPDKTIISQVKIYNESMLDGLVKDHSYWFKRGIKEETVAEFKGGTAKKGNMINRYVFPIYNPSGKIVGFSGRSLIDSNRSDFIKWKHLGDKVNRYSRGDDPHGIGCPIRSLANPHDSCFRSFGDGFGDVVSGHGKCFVHDGEISSYLVVAQRLFSKRLPFGRRFRPFTIWL
jgi:hypothetical protein